MIARNWGNMDSGWREVGSEDNGNVVLIEAYCIDYQTNNSYSVKKSIRMQRSKKGGIIQHLSDERDRMEHVSSYASRYVRQCIASVIPVDIVEEAMIACDKTLSAKAGTPIAERIEKMADVFMSIGVTTKMIETRLRHKMETCSETELLELGRVYTTLKDDMGKMEDYFPVEGADAIGKKPPVAIKKKETPAPSAAPPPTAHTPPAAPAANRPPHPKDDDDSLV
jgi:hypothetical protein